ncbi:non-ribosomal peptide synthetase, partial [Paenibacillus gorillae]|uniref:non-ribosomal peptide synthetase n=1 Tax=Paenibacillus gorillae TaxID=1243662 RepID=UPI0005A7E1D3
MITNDHSIKATISANQETKEKEYWTKKFAGQLVSSSFPFDRRSPSNNVIYKVIEYSIPLELSKKLTKMSNYSNYSLNIILIAIVNLLISRYTNNRDIIIGTPIYEQKVEGEYINTVLALRNIIETTTTFKELLFQVKQTVTEAHEKQNYPIEALLRNLDMSQIDGEFSLFDVIVLLDNIHNEKYIQHIAVNMIFSFCRVEDRITGKVQYNSLCYDQETVNRIIDSFLYFMVNIVFDVNEQVFKVGLLSPIEKDLVINQFNNNKKDISNDGLLTELIDYQSEKNPNNIAIEFEEQKITYGELREKSNKIAKMLYREQKLQSEELVAIVMDRSINFVVTILGIWKAGGAYIPIDPSYPQERIKEIINDAGIRFVCTQKEYRSSFDRMHECCGKLEKIIYIDQSIEELTNQKVTIDEHTEFFNQANLNCNHIAYVIYTSGSTGSPKGVIVEHVGMMNHIRAKIDDLEITFKSIIAQNASQCFDISVWQFFTALVVGGKTIIYSTDTVINPDKFLMKIIENSVSILEIVPSYLTVIIELLKTSDLNFKTLRYLVVTGEEVKPNLVKSFFEKFPMIRMVNAYGPTEASDDITHYVMTAAPTVESIPIGKPIRNFNIYIVDDYMNLCPIGVKGEICVAGIGVGRGYLNDKVKTELSFMPDPFVPDYVRMFKTGDLGSWLSDGTIKFYGRKDNQLKIRGYRIEPGEIERRLVENIDVREAVVIDCEKEEGGKYLCAYVVVINNSSITINELRDYLKKHLPAYMIPTFITIINAIPLLDNGKIDKKSLLLINVNNQIESSAPANHIEGKLIQVFSEVLKLNSISVNDNFFELGGDSIRAMQVAARLQKHSLFVDIKDILYNPTIIELSKNVKKLVRKIDQRLIEGPIPLTPIQHWFFDHNFSDQHHFNQSILLYSDHGFDKQIVKKVFDQVVNHHDALRIVYKINEGEIDQINRGLEGDLVLVLKR